MNPYALSKPHVALVGMAETSRHLAPFDDSDVEIWAINESYHPKNHKPKKLWKKKDEPEPYMPRWDRWFQLHPKWDYMRLGNFNHENHPYWLTNKTGRCLICNGKGQIKSSRTKKDEYKVCQDCFGTGEYDPSKHGRTLDFPIYLQEQDDDIPGSYVYPLDEITSSYGLNAQHMLYHTNSMSLMLAFAMLIGLDKPGGETLKKVSVWGFEMSAQAEYADQKPCAEFWLGVLIGRAKGAGIELEIPEKCALLGQTVPLYAFEKTPGLTSMHAEIRVNAINKGVQKAQGELNQIRGAKGIVMQKMKAMKGMSKKGAEALQKEAQSIVKQELDKVGELNAMFGALQEAKHTHAETLRQTSTGDVSYLKFDGGREKIDISEFEKEAFKQAGNPEPEDKSDEISLLDGEDAITIEEG